MTRIGSREAERDEGTVSDFIRDIRVIRGSSAFRFYAELIGG